MDAKIAELLPTEKENCSWNPGCPVLAGWLFAPDAYSITFFLLTMKL